MIIYVDVDSTIADLGTAWLGRYNQDYGDHLTNADIRSWHMADFVKPECGMKIYEYLEDPSLYDEVKPIPYALRGVNTLREMGHRVIFVTSSTNGSAGRKLRWLQDNGFLEKNRLELDYIEMHDKSLLRGDVLIDDGPHNIHDFPGLGILFRQPHNEYWEWTVAFSSWPEICEFFSDALIPVGTHITELKRPLQTQGFKQLMERMYAVHLDKNADYSPANILGAGEIGLMTRIWDKVSRLMNLMGFRIEIASSTFEKPQAPKNESIDDNVMDLAVYAIIWQLFRKGSWGK